MIFGWLIFAFSGYLIDQHKLNRAFNIAPATHVGILDDISIIQSVGRMFITERQPLKISQRPEEDIKSDKLLTNLMWLEEPVNDWVGLRGYLQPMITIEQLASTLGTNRAYLSAYINHKYGYNFRNWIAQLRLEYSKELLLENKDLSIADVAEMVRYSQSSYSTIFKKHYGISVSQWRSLHLIKTEKTN